MYGNVGIVEGFRRQVILTLCWELEPNQLGSKPSMEVVGLVSGGKDSCYNMMCAVKAGHRIVALANLHPDSPGELDSYMYQSVASEGIHMIAEAMDLPLYRREIKGKPLNQDFDYCPTAGDEVEDLYELLKSVKVHHPSLQGVSAGAILSSYQKLRVEDVCRRLNLTPLCYLWERNQTELLSEMISNGLDAILVKVAAIGLNKKHLGLTLSEVESTLDRLHSQYGVHPCGEGGEYETFVLDCPLFHKRILIEQSEIVTHQDDPIAPVHYLRLSKLRLVDK